MTHDDKTTTCTLEDIARGIRGTGVLCESIALDYAWDYVQFRKRPWWRRMFWKWRVKYVRVI